KLADKISALSSREGQKTLRAVTPLSSTVKTGESTTKNAIDLLLRAIRRKKKVGFQYASTGIDLKKHCRFEGHTYPVSPYALIWRQDKYYLIGSYGSYNKLSYYRLDRIRNLEILDEPTVPMEDFLGPNADQQLQVFVEQNLYNYSGKRTTLRLSVNADMLDVLVDTFGNGFHIVTQNEHKVIVAVTVSDGWGLNTWLLQHGDCVQVLEPIEIREEMRKLIGEIYKSYQ
ncbi:MAG: WYL domain-containing protein, partial [Clostridium lundense]|nr:WYL domain-containing protein [Clostridium lundense]